MVKVTAFVPVRGGSKSIPLKNIKSFCGKPLVYWNLVGLENCHLVENIIVATDSDLIEETVLKFKLNKIKIFRRSEENASDAASTESVMLEYLNSNTSVVSKTDLFMLVQATSPFTESLHFTEAIKLIQEKKFDSLLSCVRLKRFFWNIDGSPKNYDVNSRPRRQDFEGELMENGAFYISSLENILRARNRLSGTIGIYIMPEYTALEIDEDDDWIIAEKIMYKYLQKK